MNTNQDAVKPVVIFWLMLLLASITHFSGDSYIPSLPHMTEVLNTSAAMTQLTIGSYLFFGALSQLIYGPISDYIGRRKILLFGYIVYFFGGLLCTYATDIDTLLIGRVVQGLGIGAATGLFRAILRDCFHGSTLAKFTSYLSAVVLFLPAASPIIGGYIHTFFGWRANFLVLALLGLVGWLCMYLWLPETHAPKQQVLKIKKLFTPYIKLLKNPVFIGNTLNSSVSYTCLVAYATVSPFLIQNKLGYDPVSYAWLAIYITLGCASGAFINTKLLNYFKITTLIDVGNTLFVISGLTMLAFWVLGFFNVVTLVGPMVIFALGSGFVFANTFSVAFESLTEARGSASALYGCIQISVGGAGSALMAYIHEQDQMALAVFILATTLVMLFLRRGLVAWLGNPLTDKQ